MLTTHRSVSVVRDESVAHGQGLSVCAHMRVCSCKREGCANNTGHSESVARNLSQWRMGSLCVCVCVCICSCKREGGSVRTTQVSHNVSCKGCHQCVRVCMHVYVPAKGKMGVCQQHKSVSVSCKG